MKKDIKDPFKNIKKTGANTSDKNVLKVQRGQHVCVFRYLTVSTDESEARGSRDWMIFITEKNEFLLRLRSAGKTQITHLGQS